MVKVKPKLTKAELRAKLRALRVKRLEQRDYMIKVYVTPLNENIRNLERVIRGEDSLEVYIKRSEALSKYLKELVKGGNDG